MMKFAWDNYKHYAWGKNELRPLTRNGHIGNMFGKCQLFARGSEGQEGLLGSFPKTYQAIILQAQNCNNKPKLNKEVNLLSLIQS